MVWITCIYCQKWQIKRLTWLDTNFSKSLKANVNLKFSILKLFQLIVFNLKEDWYFCCYSWLSKNSIQNSFELNFFLKWCCKISIMQFYKLFKKMVWNLWHGIFSENWGKSRSINKSKEVSQRGRKQTTVGYTGI